MNIQSKNKVTEVFFSPGGSTKNISNLFCSYAEWNVTDKVDFIYNKKSETIPFSNKDIVIVSMPVFTGRIPAIAGKQLQILKGDDTPCVAIAVYGNREYEDSLLELTDILKSNGFNIIGAAAFIARHSIFPQIAKTRPDEKDKDLIHLFAQRCKKKIETGSINQIQIKGNTPYRKYSSIPFAPKCNSDCNNCGLCAKICPLKAIDENNPKKTNNKKCTACTACIYNCPKNARFFSGFIYNLANKLLSKKCSEYKEPDLFI